LLALMYSWAICAFHSRIWVVFHLMAGRKPALEIRLLIRASERHLGVSSIGLNDEERLGRRAPQSGAVLWSLTPEEHVLAHLRVHLQVDEVLEAMLARRRHLKIEIVPPLLATRTSCILLFAER
jgi:hypothetical protein